MGYMHIDNLYKNIEIMAFRECYAMEKIHGTSAHISFKPSPGELSYSKPGEISSFSGGEKHEKFVNLFTEDELMSIH